MKRIIQSILYRGSQAVKGKRFASDRPVGSVLQQIRVAQLREFDEVVLLDCNQDGEPSIFLIEQMADELRSPFAIGGNLYSMRSVDAVFRNGADKVVLKDERLVSEVSSKYGSQAAVVSIDVKDGRVFRGGGRVPTGDDPIELAQRLVRAGAGEIVLQAIDRDGMLSGYDLQMIRAVCEAVSVPVIASGGCRGADDMREAFAAGAGACAAGALWLFEDATPRQCKEALRTDGLEVRL